MADQIEEQDVELTEDESVEEAHDPKNAELSLIHISEPTRPY